MTMNKPVYYRRMFLIAAFWNWSIAIGSTVFYRPLFSKLGMPIPESPVWLLMFLGCVFVFGIGYYWVGNRPPPSKPRCCQVGDYRQGDGFRFSFVFLLYGSGSFSICWSGCWRFDFCRIIPRIYTGFPANA